MQQPLRERLLPYVQDLKLRRVTDREVAAALGVNPNYLNWVFNAILGESRVKGSVSYKRESDALIAAARRDLREHEAERVLNGTKTLEQAAHAAGCSVRTIRRYVEKIASRLPETDCVMTQSERAPVDQSGSETL